MQADIKWLDHPEIFRVNRLDAHSDHKFFESEESYQDKQETLKRPLNGIWKFQYSVNAKKRPVSFYENGYDISGFDEIQESYQDKQETLKRPLNGIWKFQYSVNAKKRPVSFYENGYDISGFDEIQVPQHIELAGYDKIHYINTMYPWEGHEYRRPAGTCNHTGEGMFSEASYNPTGSYIRFFDLDEALIGKRVILSFEGAEQAIYVWVNGEFVGYAEDSFTVSEFDITRYVKETGNRLCVEVHKRSTAAFLEDQVNGEFVGYAEDSFTVSEFDITRYVKETGNRLCVEVHKRSTAAFLEDQDFFRFFGLFRDVNLYGLPDIHVSDLWLRPKCALDGRQASMEIELKTTKGKTASYADARAEICLLDGHQMIAKEEGPKCALDGRQASMEIELKTTKGKTASYADARAEICLLDGHQMIAKEEASVSESFRADLTINEPVQLWNCDDPKLYQVEIRIFDGQGDLIEIIPYQVGFRTICIEDGIIKLNGRRLIINGVNRHEWNAKSGRCISENDEIPYQVGFRTICIEDGIIKLNGRRLIINGVNRHEWNAKSGRCISENDEIYDIECMKRNNINAVRTCHYPDRTTWYYRCDEAGIYVMAEVNLESHGSWQKMGAVEPSWNVPGSVELWQDVVLDREKSNFEMFKNHTSIYVMAEVNLESHGSWQKMGAVEPSWNVPGSVELWQDVVLDRVKSNFEMFKNHTSVLFWSLGNESYAGEVLKEMNAYYKKRDPGRLVHYGGTQRNECVL